MKLTKYQKSELLKHDWDVYEAEHGQNCAWIRIEPSDGEIFGQVAEELGLTGDDGDIKLLIVGTQQGD
jgi:hypothetical protein